MNVDASALRAVLLIGPTAVGKTAFLEELSQHRSIEVISADSRQIYRGFSISTSHPSAQMRRRVPHHLIDELDFTQPYTISDFVTRAQTIITQIAARGQLPIVSGGTAYYMHHLLRGLPATPAPNAAVRAKLRNRLAAEGLNSLYAQLCANDPVYAESVASTDVHRIMRALEIIASTGTQVSLLRKYTPKQNPIKYTVFGLTRNKEDLHRRIEMRIDEMHNCGLAREVYLLYKKGLRMEHNSARTIGVQEFLQNPNVIHVWNHDDSNGHIETALWRTVRIEIIKNTKHYAKRQYTFFKRFENVQWFDASNDLEKKTAIPKMVHA